jgi:hypothetical protein
MQEILDFMLQNGIPVDANTVLVLAFLYFTVFRWIKGQFIGIGKVIDRFLEIQGAREKASKDLALAIRALCFQLSGQECNACPDDRSL